MKLQDVIKQYKDKQFISLGLSGIDFSQEKEDDINEFCAWLAKADIIDLNFRTNRGVLARSIDVSTVKPEIIIKIFQAIGQNQSIKYLQLPSCNLYGIYRPETLDAMFAALGQKQFSSIALPKNNLSSDRQLFHWAAVNTGILDLSDNRIGPGPLGFIKLLTVIQSNPNLYELSLKNCQLNYLDAWEHIGSYRTWNPGVPEGQLYPAIAADQAETERLFVEFVRTTRLIKLDISNNDMRTEFEYKLIAAAELNPTLEFICDSSYDYYHGHETYDEPSYTVEAAASSARISDEQKVITSVPSATATPELAAIMAESDINTDAKMTPVLFSKAASSGFSTSSGKENHGQEQTVVLTHPSA